MEHAIENDRSLLLIDSNRVLSKRKFFEKFWFSSLRKIIINASFDS